MANANHLNGELQQFLLAEAEFFKLQWGMGTATAGHIRLASGVPDALHAAPG
jgi:hypothetical protein